MKDRKKQLLLIVGIISLILVTVGVTYAFFNYAKEGSTENSLTTGTITFLYTETTKVGNGISLTNAFPISDSKGKDLTGDGNVFDFKITSQTPTKTAILYEITARKSAESANIDSNIKVYLTKVNGSEEEVLLAKYGSLNQTSRVDEETYTEKVLYTGKVPAESSNYEQAYRLRMWVSEDADFSTGNLNDKTFTLTVNVYADAKVVTDSDVALESNINIKSVEVNGVSALEQEDNNYKSYVLLNENEVELTVNTENQYSKVTIEQQNASAKSSNIQRLSTNKTFKLNKGNNYFKIIIESEDETNRIERQLNIYAANEFDFDYIRKQDSFTAPVDGYYNLEVWGGQGGSANGQIGGYGGYSTGTTFLTKGEIIYIVVGGAGSYSYNLWYPGAYNGGGACRTYTKGYCGAGGGATHIAKVSGTLDLLSDYKGELSEDGNYYISDNILIVAGGGGGAGYTNTSNYGTGGHAGGYIGSTATSTARDFTANGYGTGGTQIAGGYHTSRSNVMDRYGSFGQGYSDSSNTGTSANTAGGGGGFFGGGGTILNSSGGGSGYIASSNLISYKSNEKAMYCYECNISEDEETKTFSIKDANPQPVSKIAKIGSGYARITYINE